MIHGGSHYSMNGSSKYTIQRMTGRLSGSVVAVVNKDCVDVEHHVELFDALLAEIILDPSSYKVVKVLNEFGDSLSDMPSRLLSSLGTGVGGNYLFDEINEVGSAVFDPAGGTAPGIAGKNPASPAAVHLVFGMLLDRVDRCDLGHARRLSLLGCIEKGHSTRVLGGKLNTDEFTQVVIDNIPAHL